MSALTDTRDHARLMARAAGPDAVLWAQIADEIDAYLTGLPTLAEDLFGAIHQTDSVTVQPEETL